MSEALALARDSAAGGGRPFGATVVIAGSTVGRGRDRSALAADPTHHAEITAIREAISVSGRGALAGATVFASCEPCVMCAAAILRSGIRVVRFASSREAAAAVGYSDVCSPGLSREVLREADVEQMLGPEGEAILREHAVCELDANPTGCSGGSSPTPVADDTQAQ